MGKSRKELEFFTTQATDDKEVLLNKNKPARHAPTLVVRQKIILLPPWRLLLPHP